MLKFLDNSFNPYIIFIVFNAIFVEEIYKFLLKRFFTMVILLVLNIEPPHKVKNKSSKKQKAMLEALIEKRIPIFMRTSFIFAHIPPPE